jgi:hypothetical protein
LSRSHGTPWRLSPLSPSTDSWKGIHQISLGQCFTTFYIRNL